MPTYEYVCKSCGETFEVFQSFSDKPLRKHECGGDLQKVFHARGIVFKGPGFYSTDARSSGSSTSTGNRDKTEKKPDKSDTAKSDKPKPEKASASTGSSGD